MYDPHDATVKMCEQKYSKYYKEDLDAATKQRYDEKLYMLPGSVDDPYINSLLVFSFHSSEPPTAPIRINRKSIIQSLWKRLVHPCQHGEFWYVTVSEQQRLRLCGQNLCGPFVGLYWQPTSKRTIEQWRPTARQKRLYLHHQGEFHHNYCVVVSLHDSDHDGVVRMSVDLSCVL